MRSRLDSAHWKDWAARAAAYFLPVFGSLAAYMAFNHFTLAAHAGEWENKALVGNAAKYDLRPADQGS